MKRQNHIDKAEEEFAAEARKLLDQADGQDTAAVWAAVAAWAAAGPAGNGPRTPRPGSSRRDCPSPGCRASARCPDPNPVKPGHPLAGLRIPGPLPVRWLRAVASLPCRIGCSQDSWLLPR